MANKQFTVLLDLDSTVYNLLDPTLDYANKRYGLTLSYKDVTEWYWDKKYNIDLKAFWDTEETFIKLEPFRGAIAAIQKVHDAGVKQVFLSYGYFRYAAYEKFLRADRDFGFLGGASKVLLTGGDKDLIKGDVLVDDGPHNLEAFKKAGGRTVLANLHNAPYCQFPMADEVLTDWKQYPSIINNLRLNYGGHGWEENVG